ncbi:MAG: hypothetical protein K0R29_2858 [Pseudobdellovibrio sp.]|jgi:uncharacterized protein (TIGR02147 family)|nr:hypothetical protein [Pseudobdellovibrio sp.]
MNIYEFDSYQKYLQNWLFSQPKHGHGVLKSWAQKLDVHSTLLSQVVNGKKDFSLEQADKLTEILNLSEQEAEYFMLLLMHSRAGTQSLKKKIKRKISEAQDKSKNISQRLKVQNALDEESKAVFYSSWIYSAIRNLTALKEMKSAEDIANFLGLPRDLVQTKIEFLIEKQLCVMNENGLTYGPSRTHVPADSPWVSQHHKNWRERGEQKMPLRDQNNLYFTFPMSLSEADAEKIRKLIPSWIEEIHKIVGPSESECVRCLNIDFFKY